MLSIDALVIGKINSRMDHSAIRISIQLKGVVPRNPTYNKVIERRVRNLSDDQIDELITTHFESWIKKYYSFIKEGSDKTSITPEIVNCAAEKFDGIIKEVKSKAWRIVYSRVDSNVSEKLDSDEVRVAMEDAKLSKMALKIKCDPTNLVYRKTFLDIQKNRTRLLRTVASNQLKADMYYQDQKCSVSTKKFFSVARRLLSKNGPQDLLSNKSNDKEKRRLENDATYLNKDLSYEIEVDANITPLTLLDFDINRSDIARIISEMKKIDKFYKVHSAKIEWPLLILNKLIGYSNYFPKILRRSKLTQLPNRHIYSLEALPKICEKILHESLERCLEIYYEKYEDPLQMAYEKGRGCESCNAISLTVIEKSLLHDKKSCIQVYIDLKKAFNRANRQTILNEVQKIAGAGSLMKSWFEDRSYTFDGKEYNLDANCGVLPGTLLGVFGFKSFINTDETLTAKNKELLWASGYSDDRSPCVNADTVNSGQFQSHLDKSVDYMKTQGCEYHLNGKKEPCLLYFRKHDSKKIVDMSNIKLNNITIKHVSKVTILGLNIATESKRRGSFKYIKQFGYVLEPTVSRFITLARDIELIKGEFIPSILKHFVSSYLCGFFRFCAGLYWVRGTIEDINTIRYYYCISMASILGFSPYEAVGASCMSNQSVKADNLFYINATVIIGLPTLRDMAIISARTIINQVFELKPDYFIISQHRSEKSELVGKDGYPKSISQELKFTIMHDLLNLCKIKTTRENDVKWKSKMIFEDLYDKAVDQFSETIDVMPSTCNTKNKQKNYHKETRSFRSNIDPMNVMSLYRNLCRYEFGIFDRNARRLKFRTPSIALKTNIVCSVRPVDSNFNKIAKSKKQTVKSLLSCITKSKFDPSINLDRDTIICRACSGTISDSEVSISCVNCCRMYHLSCVSKVCSNLDKFQCSTINKVDKNEYSITPKVRDMCLVCGMICEYPTRISCHVDDCGFGAHPRCIHLLQDIVWSEDIPCEQFSCDDVTVQFDITELKSIMNRSTLSINEKNTLVKKNKVITSKYTKCKRRYENDLIECKVCNQSVDLDESDHILLNCTGLNTTPCRVLKRRKMSTTLTTMSSMLSNKTYLNRMTEYSKLEAQNFFYD